MKKRILRILVLLLCLCMTAAMLPAVAFAVDTTPPTVTGVTPGGAGVSIATTALSVTFNKVMNTGIAGTVTLDNGATVQNPQWSNGNKTVTYDLSGLAYGAAYSITVSGFEDAAGNTMAAGSTHSFTTMEAPPAIVLGTNGIIGGGANWVYYGEYSGSPVMWRVLAETGGNGGTYVDNSGAPVDGSDAMLLLSEYLLDEGSVYFDNVLPYDTVWQGSMAQASCGAFYINNFEIPERSAIAATSKTDGIFASSTYSVLTFHASSNILSGDKIFFLSAEEAETSSYGFSSDSDRIARVGSSTGSAGWWWLRSPCNNPSGWVGAVEASGGAVGCDLPFGIETSSARPAFNLNQSSILFSSAAEGGKFSGVTGAGALTAVSSAMPTEWKLTLRDSGRSFDVAESAAAGATGEIITLNYTGATVYDSVSAPNEYISAMIIDSTDNILYYGRLAQPAGAGGTVNVAVPPGLADGSYTLKLFSEQYNGDKETDYASSFSDVALTVDSTAPTVTGRGSPSSSKPTYTADIKAGNGAHTSLPITVNTGTGNAAVSVGAQQGNALAVGENLTIEMPSIQGVGSYTLSMPVACLSAPNGKGTLVFNTDTGSLTLPADMLSGIAGEGSSVGISIGQGDKSGLNDEVKAAVDDRPVIQLGLVIDGIQTEWNNPDAPVTVSIPYTPTSEELANPDSIVIWYIDGSGNAVCVPNGCYDPVTGTVIFDVTHFSDYAVAYNNVSFSDVPAGAWYYKAVSFIAARDISTGTGGDNFSPGAKLRRGDFLVLLMKAYGITPDADLKHNFSDADDAYYTGYLAAAKRQGISSGVGGNLFAPAKEITRQEMFTLLYNALKVIGQLPQGDSDKMLSDFSDTDRIPLWAKDAMTLLTETGTIAGSGGKLNPTGTATRAEMAQVLYHLLSE